MLAVELAAPAGPKSCDSSLALFVLFCASVAELLSFAATCDESAAIELDLVPGALVDEEAY